MSITQCQILSAAAATTECAAVAMVAFKLNYYYSTATSNTSTLDTLHAQYINPYLWYRRMMMMHTHKQVAP